jgi:hypothetical protein
METGTNKTWMRGNAHSPVICTRDDKCATASPSQGRPASHLTPICHLNPQNSPGVAPSRTKFTQKKWPDARQREHPLKILKNYQTNPFQNPPAAYSSTTYTKTVSNLPGKRTRIKPALLRSKCSLRLPSREFSPRPTNICQLASPPPTNRGQLHALRPSANVCL